MAEKLKGSPEHKSENLDLSAEIKNNLERARKEAKESTPEQPDAHELTAKVEQQAISGKEVTVGEQEDSPTQAFGVYSEMKSQAYTRSLRHIRQRLSVPERTLSKIAHNKVVESASNGLSKTVARPSGILGGGIAALLGSSILLYMAKYYGFQYNFFVFFVLLAGGFVIGLIAELLVRAFAKAKR